MTRFVPLSADVSVSPQLQPGDLAEAARQGFGLVINNRPDGEAPDQPTGAEIRAAAIGAGLGYAEIPVSPAGMSIEMVEECATLLRDSETPVLMFCRSGTRSANLATLAAALLGADIEPMIAAGRDGGYDLAPLRPMAARLAGR
jgi:uncharacterized protein (TIGR01244 family)